MLVTGLGHYEEGAQVLEDAVRDYPTSVDSHFYLGRAYLGLNRLAEAIQSFERAVALVPLVLGVPHLVGAGERAGR